MVDPSKDQLYQQRLWGHLGAYGGHPSLVPPTSSVASAVPIPHIYDSPHRLHPHFAGLVPTPSPGPPVPPPTSSTASYKEPSSSIPAYGGHYTHLAALSAAVAASSASSDYSRPPLPAHGPDPTSAQPLPAHMQSRHPAYPPNPYHEAYANYYNQRMATSAGREPMSSQPASAHHNGFDATYGHLQQQQPHQPVTASSATAAHSKPAPEHDRNGFKANSNSFPAAYGYPPTNGPTQPSYHYPFDVTKIGYHHHHHHQQQHYANHHQHHHHQQQQQHHHQSPLSVQPANTPRDKPASLSQSLHPTPNNPPSSVDPSLSANSAAAMPSLNNGLNDAPVNLAGRHSSLPPSATMAALHYPNSKARSVQPHQPQVSTTPSSSYPAVLPPKKMAAGGLGPLESALRGIGSNSESESSLKRRPSDNLLSDQQLLPEMTKKAKIMVASDPYRFEEDLKSEDKAIELTRFNSAGSSIKSETPPLSSSPGTLPNGSGSVYKFKSALLSRNSSSSSSHVELPKLSSKSVPLTFEVHSSTFAEACDRFMDDMNSKPVSFSRRASLESFVAAQAAKAARKAEKKAEKEQQKAEAAERKAEREDRKEKERLGLLPPQEKSPKKPRGSQNRKSSKKSETKAETVENEETGEEAPDILVKENEDPKSSPSKTSNQNFKPPTNNNHNPAICKEEKPKKGGTWALPIVPKMPQKPPTEKRKGLAPLPNLPVGKAKKTQDKTAANAVVNNKNGTQGLANVWLQAFGAKPNPEANGGQAQVKQEPGLGSEGSSSGQASTEKLRKPAKKTYLDIPPEKRRRPKPNFGGLIHFSPDWERAVQRHHEKSRVPQPLIDNIRVKPYILKSSSNGPQQPLPVNNSTKTDIEAKEDSNRYAALSSYLGSPTHTSDHGSPPPLPSPSSCTKEEKLSAYPYLTIKGSAAAAAADGYDGVAIIVNKILAHRKKLRQSLLGRMFKVPFMKEKKKRVREEAPLETIKLMPTPGLPEIKDDLASNDDNVMKSFNNFRRLTLLRYLDGSASHSPELKAKILDWKPEVLSSKTRHQTTKAREVTAYKEIFGTELPGKSKKPKGKGNKKKNKNSEKDSTDDVVSPTKQTPEKPKKQTSKNSRKAAGESSESITKTPEKSDPLPPLHPPNPPPEESDENEEVSEAAQELQTELQTYALDLLDTNASWEKRKVIQNLVIWEPVTDPALLALPPDVTVPGTVSGTAIPINIQPSSGHLSVGRKKAKKVRKRQSGLDFSRKSKAVNKGSREASRAHSPFEDQDQAGSSRQLTHTLDNILNDTKHMVMDKSAGETILHRASKMGYPDVAAYALDMIKMNPTVKDNAGFPPIHKAALKGHAEVVDYLIRYGADPNTNVKGTRPLHEALEGGHIEAVVRLLSHGSDPLLYDYSGNMPIDLARESEVPELFKFFSAILSDLHGKEAVRWNVSHERDFILPNDPNLDMPDNDTTEEEEDFMFEVSSQHLPPEFKLSNRLPSERFILHTDMKKFISMDLNKLSAKCEVINVAREDFLKSAYSCLLGTSVDIVKSDPVILVKIDPTVRKMLGIITDEAKLTSPMKKGNKSLLL